VAGYVEGDRSAADLVAEGFDPTTVARVIALVDGAEYKRRQTPPGVRISAKAFGKDRRMPITNHYRGAVADPSDTPGPGPESVVRMADSKATQPSEVAGAIGVKGVKGLARVDDGEASAVV
jgi:hypothetical protein